MTFDTATKTMAANKSEINAMLGAIRRNPALVASIRTEIDTLVSEVMLSTTGGREMINGSGNGMAYTAQITMSKRERLAILQKVLDYYNSGTGPSSWAKTNFLP